MRGLYAVLDLAKNDGMMARVGETMLFLPKASIMETTA